MSSSDVDFRFRLQQRKSAPDISNSDTTTMGTAMTTSFESFECLEIGDPLDLGTAVTAKSSFLAKSNPVMMVKSVIVGVVAVTRVAGGFV